jgi:hypothetical protein
MKEKIFLSIKLLTVIFSFLILTNCLTNKKAKGSYLIQKDSVLVKCELFLSKIGIWFSGQEKAVCLMPATRYYEESDFIVKVPEGSEMIFRKKITSGGVDAPTAVSYKVDMMSNNKLFATNVYVQDYYFKYFSIPLKK